MRVTGRENSVSFVSSLDGTTAFANSHVPGDVTLVDDLAMGVILHDDTTVAVGGDTAIEGDIEYRFADVFVDRNVYALTRSRGVEFGPDRNLYATSEAGGYPGPVFRYHAATGILIDVFALHKES